MPPLIKGFLHASSMALIAAVIDIGFIPAHANIQVQEATTTPWPTPANTVPMPVPTTTAPMPSAAPYQYSQDGGYQDTSGYKKKRRNNSTAGQSAPYCGFGSTCGAVPLNSNPTGMFGTGTW